MTGIYFLLYKREIVYIGQSIKFPERIKGHGNKKIDSVRLIECHRKKLAYYEHRWINVFRPKYNKTLKFPIGEKKLLISVNKEDRRMLSRMCNKNKRTVSNQITFALRQSYQRQFKAKEFIPTDF